MGRRRRGTRSSRLPNLCRLVLTTHVSRFRGGPGGDGALVSARRDNRAATTAFADDIALPFRVESARVAFNPVGA